MSATAGAGAAAAARPEPESILNLHLVDIAGTRITVATLVSIAAVLLATFLAATLLARLLARVLRARGKAGEGEIRALSRVVRYAVWITGLAIGLSTAGINLTALFTAGAIFAVALGFAMKEIVENFVAGVILLLERAIKPGDVLEVEGQMVKVVTMGIRTTIARTLDDEDLVIPNSTLSQSSVKNYTLRDPHYRIRAAVGVSYASDMGRVREVLAGVAQGVDWRLAEPEPRILLLQFGSSSVDWEISVWTDDPWRVRSLRSDLQLRVWDALRAAGITIAFPQVDVHVDRELLRALQAGGAS